MRAHDDALGAAVSSRQRQRQVANGVEGDLEPDRFGRRPDQVMRRLLTSAVAVADDTAAAACGAAERLEQRGGQLEIRFDRAEHQNIPSKCRLAYWPGKAPVIRVRKKKEYPRDHHWRIRANVAST